MPLEGPRGARPEEVAAVIALADAIFGGEAPRMGPEFPTLFCAANAANLLTFWDGPVPVSLVGFWRGTVWTRGRRLAVAHVGAVCTRPEYRAQGLAGALLAEGMARLRAEGVALLLISGDRSLYRRIGARRFGHLRRYRLAAAALGVGPAPVGADAQRASTGGGPWTMLPARAPAELAALYAREPVRYERSAAEWSALLAAKEYLPPARGHLSLCAWGGAGGAEPAAYALCGPAHRPRSGEGGAVLPVVEFAGERRAIPWLLGEAMRQTGAESAQLLVQPGDAPLVALLTALGAVAEPCGHQGTARVLDFAAFASATGAQPPAGGGEPGSEAEALAAAEWTMACLGDGAGGAGLELPRNDGLNYI